MNERVAASADDAPACDENNGEWAPSPERSLLSTVPLLIVTILRGDGELRESPLVTSACGDSLRYCSLFYCLLFAQGE